MHGRFQFTAMATVAAVAFLAGAVPGWACDSTSCALVTKGSGGTLAKGAFRLDLSYRQTDQTEPWAGGDPTDTVLRPKVDFEHGFILAGYHREVGGTERYLQADLSYGVSSRATLFVGVPLLIQRNYDVAHGGSFLQSTDTQGFGDILAGVHYALLKGPADQLMVRAALKLPTGEFRLINGFDRTINDPTLQPGTGSWDFATGADFTRFNMLGLDWTASASYQANTTNDLQYRFGDDAIGSLGVSRGLVGRLGGSLQVKGWHKGRSTFLDRPVPSTGATIVYLTPGLRFAAPARMSAYAYLQVPVYRYVNEAQLTPRLAFFVGWAKTF
jgi:hypothetical protein